MTTRRSLPTSPCLRLHAVAAALVAAAFTLGCSSAANRADVTSTTTTGTGTGVEASGGGSSTSSGEGGGGSGGGATTGGPTPSIFSVTEDATLALAEALSGQAPFTVHLTALEDVPQTCIWTPPGATAPCNPEAQDCQPSAATPAAQYQAISTCLRQRDTDYDTAMSSKYLGGGDVIETHFDWDFGDQGASFAKVSGFSASHVYDTPGTYSVKLQVRSAQGAVGSVTVPVTVTASARPEIDIATDSDLAQVLAAPKTGTAGRKIALRRGATFHVTTGAFQLVNGDWITTYGDPTAAAPILEVAYPMCGSSCYIKLFATNGLRHLVVEGLDIRVMSGSQRPFLAEPNGVDVVFRDLVISNGSGFTGPSRAFTLEGRGMLVQNVGAPRNPDGSWASSGLDANFAFMTGQNIALYGNHIYVDAADGNGEPGVRSCGSGVAFISVVGNDIGGWFGKASTISIRSGTNVYFGNDNVMWGVFDLQTGCSPNTFMFPTHDVVVEGSYLQNNLFQVNPGVFGLAFRDNVMHRQNVQGSQYPLAVTVQVEVSGGTDTWSTDHIELVANTFLFEANVGKPFWLEGGQAASRIDFIDNLFYSPNVGTVLQMQRPNVATNPWDFLGAVSGNAFFMGKNGQVASIDNGGTASAVSLATWNAIPLAGGATASDTSFDPSTLTLPVLASQAVSNDVIEPVASSRPAASAPFATSADNLFVPSGAGVVDVFGADHDMTGATRPAADQGGWTPGALQAN